MELTSNCHQSGTKIIVKTCINKEELQLKFVPAGKICNWSLYQIAKGLVLKDLIPKDCISKILYIELQKEKEVYNTSNLVKDTN